MSIKSKRNKIFIIILAVIFILSFLAISVIMSIKKYHDTHTWATIRITGEINSDTADSFDDKHEYSIGDTITIGNVILDITDISTNGNVEFSVKQGHLYNEERKTIESDNILKNTKSNYKLDNEYVSLTVTDNRFQ